MSWIFVLYAVAMPSLQLTSGENTGGDKDFRQADPTHVKFPTITVCPVNMMRKSYIEADENAGVREAIDSFSLFEDFYQEEFVKRFDDPSDPMHKIRNMKYEEVIENGGLSSDRLLQCIYNSNNCYLSPAFDNDGYDFNFDRVYVRENTIAGRCWRVNPEGRLFVKTGRDYGALSLTFWADDQDKSLLSRTKEQGFEVKFHENGTFGSAAASSYIIKPGHYHKANLRRIRAVKSGDGMDNCSNSSSQNSYGVQNIGSCALECRDKALYEKCGCVLIAPPINKKRYESCSLKQWAKCGLRQYLDWYKDYTDVNRADDFCPCSPVCEEVRYDVQMSSSPHSPSYVEKMSRRVKQFLSQPDFGFSRPEFGIFYNSSSDIPENLVTLEVSLSSLHTTEVKEITDKKMPNDPGSATRKEEPETKMKRFKFPTITICSFNKVSKAFFEENSEVKEYFEMTKRKEFAELAARISDPNDNMTKIRYITYEDLVQMAGPGGRNSDGNRLAVCEQRGTYCIDSSFTMENSRAGRCWRVNPEGTMAGKTGDYGKLTLMLWADVQDYTISNMDGDDATEGYLFGSMAKDERKQGFEVKFHDDNTVGSATFSSFYVTPGTFNKANVRRVKTVKTGGSSKQCDPSPAENSYGAQNEGSCALECKDRALYAACGCVDVVPPMNNNGYRSCTLEEWLNCGRPQYQEWHRNYTDTSRADNTCTCKPRCEDVQYEAKMSSSSLAPDYVDGLFGYVQGLISDSNFGFSRPEHGIFYNTSNDIMENLVVLELSLTSPWMTEIKETKDNEAIDSQEGSKSEAEEEEGENKAAEGENKAVEEDTKAAEGEERDSSKTDSVKFPTITVCSYNKFKKSYIEAPENRDIKETLDMIRNYWDVETRDNFNYTNRTMNMRYEDAVQEGGPTKELFQYMICLQRKELCDTEGGYLDMPNLIFDMENTHAGRCWRLNPEGRMRGKTGEYGTMKFLLWADTQDYSLDDPLMGFSVKFHDSASYGVSENSEFMLTPGVYHKANLKRVKETRAQCDSSVKDNTYGAHNELSCALDCKDRAVFDRCGCVEIEPPLNGGKYRSCTLKEWAECGQPQTIDWYMNYTSILRTDDFCPCPTACQEIRYDAQMSSTPISPLYGAGIFGKVKPLLSEAQFNISKPDFGIIYNTSQDLLDNLVILEISLSSTWTTEVGDKPEDKPEDKTGDKPDAADTKEQCITEIDAAFKHPTQSYGYIISRDSYIRIEHGDKNIPVISEGYPKKLSEQWPGIENEVDAAFTDFENSRTYFFVRGSPRRRVYCWNWRNSEMEMSGVGEGETEFAALPQREIQGIASYHNKALFIFENEHYVWSPRSGMNENPKTSPPYHLGLDSFALLKSSELMDGEVFEKYSYEKLPKNTEIQMCN